jgi:hypothetical protein
MKRMRGGGVYFGLSFYNLRAFFTHKLPNSGPYEWRASSCSVGFHLVCVHKDTYSSQFLEGAVGHKGCIVVFWMPVLTTCGALSFLWRAGHKWCIVPFVGARASHQRCIVAFININMWVCHVCLHFPASFGVNLSFYVWIKYDTLFNHI